MKYKPDPQRGALKTVDLELGPFSVKDEEEP